MTENGDHAGAVRALAATRSQRLARFDLEIVDPDGPLGEATVAIPGATVDVQVRPGGRAARRRTEQVRKLRQEVERSEGKLANPGFVEKAPAELVQQERDKLERYRARARRAESS